MTHSNNPTSVSAIVGDELEIGSPSGGRGELLKNLLMPLILAAFATYLLVGIITMHPPEGTVFPGPRFFPIIIAGGMYVFAVLLALAELRRARSGPADDGFEEHEAKHVRVDWRSLGWVVGGFVGFSLTLTILGWIIGAALLFWCVARGFGASRPLFTLLVGLVTSSATYILFGMALGLNLPSGILGWGF